MRIILDTILTVIFIVILLFLTGIPWTPTENITADRIQYLITLSSNWGRLPGINAPENPHTGNMFLSVNDGRALWELGKPASEGIVESSMYGTNDGLIAEARGEKIYQAGVLETPGSHSFRVDVTRDQPYVTFATMIAPSPDWFIGVPSIKLLDKFGKWVSKATIPLMVLDAGSDRGDGFFNEPDYPEPRRKPVSMVTSDVLFPGRPLPIATLRIERVK